MSWSTRGWTPRGHSWVSPRIASISPASKSMATMQPWRLPTNDDVKAFRLPSIDPAAVTGQKSAIYTIDLTTNPISFKIDGVSYDENDPPQTLKLGKTEEWTVQGTVANHPFHIHVNPFEVISIVAADGTPIVTDPVWRDTILMPADGVVKFRTRYDTFTGKFVQHCHILDHEDQGMMQLLEIIP